MLKRYFDAKRLPVSAIKLEDLQARYYVVWKHVLQRHSSEKSLLLFSIEPQSVALPYTEEEYYKYVMCSYLYFNII